MFKSFSTRMPRSFSVELFSSGMAPSTYWCRTVQFPFMRFSWPISPACPSLPGWQHDHLVYPPLLPVMCHQLTSWGYTLPHHPDHKWRCWTGLDPVLTLGKYCQLLISKLPVPPTITLSARHPILNPLHCHQPICQQLLYEDLLRAHGWRPYWSLRRQYPLPSPHSSGFSFHCGNLSSFSSILFPYFSLIQSDYIMYIICTL